MSLVERATYLQFTRRVGFHGEGGRREQDRNEDDEEGGSEQAIHLEIYAVTSVPKGKSVVGVVREKE